MSLHACHLCELSTYLSPSFTHPSPFPPSCASPCYVQYAHEISMNFRIAVSGCFEWAVEQEDSVMLWVEPQKCCLVVRVIPLRGGWDWTSTSLFNQAPHYPIKYIYHGNTQTHVHAHCSQYRLHMCTHTLFYCWCAVYMSLDFTK